MNPKVRFITQTGIFVAILIVLQALTAPLGNTLVTGSLVNLVLIVSVMTSGLASGICVAAVSPILAKLFGIGPLWAIIPFIAAANIVLVLVWFFVAGKRNKLLPYVLALVLAAVAKFLVLYLGVVKMALPLFLQLPEKQAAVITAMFSFPQLITASIGGALAIIILPVLKKALKK